MDQQTLSRGLGGDIVRGLPVRDMGTSFGKGLLLRVPGGRGTLGSNLGVTRRRAPPALGTILWPAGVTNGRPSTSMYKIKKL